MTAGRKGKRANRRKSSRLAKKPRNVYKDTEENVVSSEEDQLSDFIKDSESPESDDSDVSDSDVSEKMTLRDTRRSMATRRNVRASTRKARRSYGEDSTSGEESDESSGSTNSSRSSSQSSANEDSCGSSEKKKQAKGSLRSGKKKGATRDSDDDVSGVSKSAKKRKKAAQVDSSDDDEKKKVRKRIVTPADDESDSADEPHTKKDSTADKDEKPVTKPAKKNTKKDSTADKDEKPVTKPAKKDTKKDSTADKDEKPLTKPTKKGKSNSPAKGDDVSNDKNEDKDATVKTSNGEKGESTSDDKKQPNGTATDENKSAKEDEPVSDESQETKEDPNVGDSAKDEDIGSSANNQKNGTSEKKSLHAEDPSEENNEKTPSKKKGPENLQVESKLKKETPKKKQTPSKYEGRKKALTKLIKQRNKKQGVDQSASASEEEEEEEDEEEDDVNEASEDFIVPDEDTDDVDDPLEALEDSEAENTRVYEEKKAKLQSWIEMMLCAHLQEDPGEYLRTAKFKREIPEETHKDIATVLNRLDSAIALVFSAAWKKDYREAIQLHPKFSNHSIYSRVNCEACGRHDHPSSQGIKFSGKPYNRETFETEDFVSYDKSFSVGRFCHERSEMYHRLYHFRHKLFLACGTQVNKANDFFRKKKDRDPDIDKVINQCMKNESWIDKMFSHLEKILEDAHNYTMDKNYSGGVRQMLG
ncbi:hypothetical protein Pcinc_004398 [Petrolisthes cinctipes]|uniref:DUF4211 domain-containing protein n=1 Tax=Petrolisthes cinctipes TaxID=88211 RepID=A0AAE1GFD9_PETCI|nr:hypothetical protein Pcinc_004398 [Petrolisthes cinctipes]